MGVVVVVVVEVFMFVMRDGLVGGFADIMGEVRSGLMREFGEKKGEEIREVRLAGELGLWGVIDCVDLRWLCSVHAKIELGCDCS